MPHVEVREVVKEYPGVRALGGVSLDFVPGEVHGVIGENGAGKSTLMKILAGVERATSGSVSVDGAACDFRGVQDAMRAGVAMIHQELNLVDDLSVAENLFLGREGSVVLNRNRMEEETARWLAEVGAGFAPSDMVRNLSLAEKQLVEIAKAVSTGAEVLIMDEPTAVLSIREKKSMFQLVAKLKAEGKTVILISHLLGELIENCDRISVLRDGEYVGTAGAGDVDEKSLAAMMVGRELGDMYPEIPGYGEEVVFELDNATIALSHPSPIPSPQVKGGRTDREVQAEITSIKVRAGEVLGFAGLIGSGRTELWEEILGLRGRRANYAQSIKDRHVYVSEDRKHAGLHLDFSVENNIAMPWLSRFGRIMTDRTEVRSRAESWRERLAIKVPDVSDKVGSLSGGNQQKVSLAKWLEGDPKLIVLDEPTRGVDVGSKAQIYDIIARLALEGKAVVVISSEMQELIGLCHRVVVMRGGVPVGILNRSELSEERIMELAAGVES